MLVPMQHWCRRRFKHKRKLTCRPMYPCRLNKFIRISSNNANVKDKPRHYSHNSCKANSAVCDLRRRYNTKVQQ